MKQLEAAALIEQLAQGIDPVTGEILPCDHVLCDVEIAQALKMAVRALRGQDASLPQEKTWLRANGKLHAGRPWTQEDNAQLEALYRQGMSAEQMAPLLQRRTRGVEKQIRLMRLDGTGGNSVNAKAGHRWTQEDDDLLTQLHVTWTEEQLARHFGRSRYAIHCRLIRLGLIEDDLKPKGD